MDPLSDFLDGPRARGAFLLRVLMRPPWSLEVVDEAPLTLVHQMRGRCWMRPERAEPVLLQPGDTLVVRAPLQYALATELDAETTIRIGAEQECSGSDGRDLSHEMASGVRTWGNDPEGEDCLLVGTYRSDGEVGRMLLAAMPSYFVVHDPAPTVAALLDTELQTADVGQGSMLDRLLDLLLISAVRAWATQAGRPPAMLAVARDPLVHKAVRLIQDQPQAEWTVQTMADEVGVSRAALARRFTDVVGVPPMSYLAQWRMAVGADLLMDPDVTVGAVSRRVGYASQFSFSAAFKKHYGVSPQQYRQRTSA